MASASRYRDKAYVLRAFGIVKDDMPDYPEAGTALVSMHVSMLNHPINNCYIVMYVCQSTERKGVAFTRRTETGSNGCDDNDGGWNDRGRSGNIKKVQEGQITLHSKFI